MFSYSGDPRTTRKDRIRFELADTGDPNLGPAKFQDEEIFYALEEAGDPEGWEGAASILARAFARKLASQADIKVGPLTVDYKRMAASWEAVADEYAAAAPLGTPSLSDLPSGVLDSGPMFSKGMHDNPMSPGYPPPGSGSR